MLRLALLDDYTGAAQTYGDWSALEGRVEITSFQDHESDLDRLVERLEPFDAISTVRERTPFPRALIERLPRLKLLATTGTFNRTFDLDAANERGIHVCGTTSLWDSTAELTWGLILSLARQIPKQNHDLHEGAWQTTVGLDLRGKRLGLIGLGKIGAQVAAVGKVFGMDVVAWSANLTEERCGEVGVSKVTKEELFETSDFVSIHMVLSERSRRMIGASDFARMKKTGYFINTSRGALIDEQALVDALQRGLFAGAGLDVFETEPLEPNHPLRRLDNAILTAHVGYVTADQYRTYYAQTIENIAAFLEGERLRPLKRPAT